MDGYTLVFAGLLLLCGGLGDRLGHRRVFLAGLGLFTVASAACALAPSAGFLVGARLAQGAGAATMVPASLALLGALHPEPGARARAFGVWGGIAGVAAAAGPVLGGVLVWGVGWRTVFLVNVPLGALAIWLTVRHVPATRPRGERPSLDLVAQLTGVGAVAALTTGLNEAGGRGWTDPLVLGALAAAPVAGALFLWLERRAAAPALPPRLLTGFRFPAALAVGVLLNLGFYGLLFLTTLYFQRHRGWDPLATGLALLPMGALAVVASPLSGRVAARVGTHIPAVAGLLTGAVGLLGWAAVGPHTPYALLVVPLLLTGFGTSFTMPSATIAAMEAAPHEVRGAASGAFNAARQLGSAIGVALFGTLAAASASSAFYAGMRLSAVIAAGCFVCGAARSWRGCPGPPPAPRPTSDLDACGGLFPSPPLPTTGAPPQTPLLERRRGWKVGLRPRPRSSNAGGAGRPNVGGAGSRCSAPDPAPQAPPATAGRCPLEGLEGGAPSQTPGGQGRSHCHAAAAP
ncbi:MULTISPECIES: MFS transporter [Streptomyces violaceusniger group]|uniref:MFS transporter n=1 Tax=Streptomyces rhizosphaericus TaxID=114699 RepID=A0ABN1RQT9_9ACTN|nr:MULTISPECIES: MFS transporter [Streptomyces violaceusniger group]